MALNKLPHVLPTHVASEVVISSVSLNIVRKTTLGSCLPSCQADAVGYPVSH